MMTTSTMEKIKVMLAFDEGKKIQWVIQGRTEWQDCSSPVWDWYALSYRIKPTMPRKFTRWFIELPGSRFVGPFYDEDTAKNSQYLYGSSTITVFEMTEILDNAER